jgi:SAM-dependent methyltransferase
MNMIYGAINEAVFQQIPPDAKKILDIGCGSGALGQKIKENQDCQVVGVTYSQEEANLASQVLDSVIVVDINELDTSSLRQFDCIICSHILEHLYDPCLFAKKLHNNLSVDGRIVVALPNVLHFKQRWQFIKGHFKYTDGGLMDKTHFRFFDWDTAYELLVDSGYKVSYRYADGYFPLPIIRKFVRPWEKSLNDFATTKLPSLFGVQFILVAGK